MKHDVLFSSSIFGFLCCAQFSTGAVDHPLVPSEMSALESVFNEAGGNTWRWNRLLASSTIWNFTGVHNPCTEDWQGLTCNSDYIYIDGTLYSSIFTLELTSFNMTGAISPSIGEFSYLSTLSISQNPYLSGPIPASISNLSSLRVLSMDTNSLNGSIPAVVFNMSQLISLDLSYNKLTGTIPQNANLSTMYDIEMSNNLLSGSIPESLFVSTMQFFSAANNLFSGPVPTVLNPTNYTAVELFQNLSRLQSVSLGYNQLTGALPARIGLLPVLWSFDAEFNLFSGAVPVFEHEFLTGKQKILDLYINNNLLTGVLPNEWTLPVAWLQLSGNYLTGSIPVAVFAIEDLGGLYLQDNYLSGSLPSAEEHFTLYYNQLVLNNNLLSGTIPQYLSSIPNLVMFYINNNFLTGSLENLSGAGLWYIDISSNQITGTFPASFFSNTRLISFAAAENCITGSIPQQFCNLESLLYLDLDGLTTATSCRKTIFDNIPFIETFTLQQSIPGGIPECLLNSRQMSLETLHISGNEIEWSFPSNIEIRDTLTVLSLSHNRLTGTIPASVLDHGWSELDLSFNLLSGSIDSIGTSSSGNYSLTLEVNRLSGDTPSLIQNWPNVNILNGNFFTCNAVRHDLPRHDPSERHYQCGTFNQSAIAWCVLLLLLLIGTGSVCLCVRCDAARTCKNTTWRDGVQLFAQWYSQFQEILSVISEEKHQLSSFGDFLSTLRKVMVCTTLGLCVVCLPLYSTLTVYFHTLQYEYAYILSLAYISGETPAIIVFCFSFVWVAAVMVCTLLIRRRVANTSNSESNNISNGAIQSESVNSSESGNNAEFNDDNKKDRRKLLHSTIVSENKINFKRTVLLVMLTLVNCALMLVVNGCYVTILLTYGTQIITMATLFMSVFKLVWNDVVLQYLFRNTRWWYSDSNSNGSASSNSNNNSSNSANSSSDNISSTDYMLHEMPFASFMTLFNTIIAPSIATAAVDPNCFVNAFVQPANVVTQFPSFLCSEGCSSGAELTELTTSISYAPPFSYSYQCSSAILTSYASVYVFMTVSVTFVKPVLLFLGVRLYDRLNEHSLLRKILGNVVYRMLLRPVDSDWILNENSALFNKDRFALRMVSKISIFLTFGVVFPPLAVVLCAAVCSETYMTMIIIGSFLRSLRVNPTLLATATQKLARDCAGSAEVLLLPIVTTVVPFAACFYALFIFDIYGDQTGWRDALWATLTVSCVPALIWLCYVTYFVCFHHLQQRQELWNAKTKSNEGSFELKTVGNAMYDNNSADL